jgi:methionyl-tRNA formyltransferase
MEKTKIVFFGTHEFAAFILQGLIDFPFFEVALVITQPDQPVGRKQVLTPPLTKVIAQKYKIPVVQPETLKNFEIPVQDFDISIVIEYGRIIPERLLSIPRHKTLNIHPSLLPKYRGPTPIQAALLHGESKTGVTIMQMDATMDTGPILMQKELPVAADDTFLTLREKLMPLALEGLLETLPLYIDESIKPKAQNNNEASYCKLLTRDDGKIDWQKTSSEIYNQYRAFTPWPGVWTTWNEKRLKLLQIQPSHESLLPGQIQCDNETVHIGTKDGSIEVLELQIEGKNAMDAKTFIRGYKDFHNSNVQ